MISVEQVHALEERVEKAVGYISALKTENAAIRRELEEAKAEVVKAQVRATELESAAEAFRRDQVSIEEGIIHALRKLDAFEDLVLKVGQVAGRSGAETVSPATAGARAAMEARPPVAPAIKAEAPVQAKPSSPVEAPAAAEATKTADELSLEELEAATAPVPVAEEPVQAPALEGELDIF